MLRQPLKDSWNLFQSTPTPPPSPPTISCELLHFSIFTQLLRTLFTSFLSGPFLFLFSGVGWVGAGGLTDAFNYESAVIDTTAERASLPITAGNSVDRGLPHSFQRKHELWTSPQPPAAAQNRDLNRTRSLFLSNEWQTGSGSGWEGGTVGDNWQERGEWKLLSVSNLWEKNLFSIEEGK